MKKELSLALWWWAARWLVHIWVLRYLETNAYEIKEISWTSMWAIVWALYACWNNSYEIENIANELKIYKLIDFWFNFWFIKWKKLQKTLDELFWNKNIEDLDIDLKIVATNIENWEREVFTKWKISDAVRASLSLPWIFMPYEIWNNTYMDGWIVNNLPVDVLEWENIIWISALKQKVWKLSKIKKFLWFNTKRSFFEYNYEVLHRMTLLMMKQNELKSIENSKWKSLIIQPNFWNLDYYSFDKIKEFIKLWYEETKKALASS